MEVEKLHEFRIWLDGLTEEKEKRYRDEGVSEEIIHELKKMDKECCNKYRSFAKFESTMGIDYFNHFFK